MNEQTNNALLLKEIHQGFELDTSHESIQSKTNPLQLLKWVVAELIDHDFERLLLVLYLADVNESKIRNALANTERDAASVIAEIYLERIQQRLESRIKYKQQPIHDEDLKW